MAKPKLALIPAAQGDKFYSVLPSDGVGDFDFTRNSSATRIAPTGFIQEVGAFGSDLANGYNFTNGWSTFGGGTSITNSTTFVSESGQGIYAGLGLVINKLYRVKIAGTQPSGGYLTIKAGTTGTSLGNITEQSFDKVLYFTPSVVTGTGNSFYIRLATHPASTSITITKLQIEEVVGNKSRLDYDLLNGKVVNCPHYLLEPASTNFITYSNNISQWTNSGNTVSPNVITSPDGGLNGGKVIVNNGTTAANIRPMASVAATNGLDYVFSVFVKAGEFDKINLDFSNAVFGSAGATFNLTSGILTDFDAVNVSQGIEDYGNGWYRCYLVAAAIASGSGALILRLDANGAGDGVKGLYVYGAQYEQKSFLTSYIPTNGTTITRAAESATDSGNAATFNDSEGVFMAEIAALANDGTFRAISLSSGSTTNRVLIYLNNTTNVIRPNVVSNGVVQMNAYVNVPDITNFNKVLIRYSLNNIAFWVNGYKLSEVLSTTSMPIGLNELSFDNVGGGSEKFFGKTREVQYFDSALTDAQLETLTSWTSLQEMITSQLYTNY